MNLLLCLEILLIAFIFNCALTFLSNLTERIIAPDKTLQHVNSSNSFLLNVISVCFGIIAFFELFKPLLK